MTQGSSEAKSLEHSLRVLRDQIDHRFSVSEGAARGDRARAAGGVGIRQAPGEYHHRFADSHRLAALPPGRGAAE